MLYGILEGRIRRIWSGLLDFKQIRLHESFSLIEQEEEQRIIKAIKDSVEDANAQYPDYRRDFWVKSISPSEYKSEYVDSSRAVLILEPFDILKLLIGKPKPKLRYEIDFFGAEKKASIAVSVSTYAAWRINGIDAAIQECVDKRFLALGYQHGTRNTLYEKMLRAA